MFFIQKWKENNVYFTNLSILLTYLSKEVQKRNIEDKIKNYINFEADIIVVNSFYTNILYESGLFSSSEFIDLINKFKNV